jgi:hypothetical protein
MAWPYGPEECPRCRYFERLEPPAYDDVGYEIVGVCRHPRIAMELFVLQQRHPGEMEACPCFSAKERAA